MSRLADKSKMLTLAIRKAPITTMNSESRHIALLIDGDNTQPSLAEEILSETVRHGAVSIRRVYGNAASMVGWKNYIQTCSLLPIQALASASGKNSTDIALVIDAMDLLRDGIVSGFCIVSSDGDYAQLAVRIREQGLFVMGVGKSNTPQAFRNACEVFVCTDDQSPTTKRKTQTQKARSSNEKWVVTLTSAIKQSASNDGWARLSDVGNIVHKPGSSFDPPIKKLSSLVKSRPNLFKVRGSGPKIFVQVKS